MADKKPSSRLWDFLVIFAIVYLAVEFGTRWFFPPSAPANTAPIVLSMQDSTVTLGITPIAVVKNNTSTVFTLPCAVPPFALVSIASDAVRTPLYTPSAVDVCPEVQSVPAGGSFKLPLESWKNAYFTKAGSFELTLTNSGTGTSLITSFTMQEPGFITKTFRAFVTKPLLNALILIASIIPQHDLGMAIILLTLAVKLALYIPTQRALEGQKKMQLLQPKFEAIRREYKEDPVKMQQETMKIWKEHNVNPFQSMVPLLVQFPVLIGLFYVVQDVVHLDTARHLIYPVYQDLAWTFDTNFFGLDLTKPYVWIFPPILVALQFIQIKLSLVIADKKKAKEIAKTTTAAVDTPQEVQQKVMLYVLPLMIGFFSLSYASALSIYWGFSTLFAIGQQMIVNREHIRA